MAAEVGSCLAGPQRIGIASHARVQYVERKTEDTVFQQTLKSIGS
jgi:hypothetical protein